MVVVVVVFDHFDIALFSALEQTHCTLVACDCKMSDCRCFIDIYRPPRFVNILPSCVLTSLFSCCMAGAT